MTSTSDQRPIVAITPDVYARDGAITTRCAAAYIDAVANAGATPVLLAPCDRIDLSFIDALVLTGGDDPVMEPFGVPTSPHAVRTLERRQRFETELLERAQDDPDLPVLGVCLGMQMMALVAGGTLNQHLPDTHGTHAIHWEHEHPITSTNEPVLASGVVRSKHRQAIDDPGRYTVVATADDGVVEAIWDPSARFRLGAQWHPERTQAHELGQKLFDDLALAARERRAQKN